MIAIIKQTANINVKQFAGTSWTNINKVWRVYEYHKYFATDQIRLCQSNTVIGARTFDIFFKRWRRRYGSMSNTEVLPTLWKTILRRLSSRLNPKHKKNYISDILNREEPGLKAIGKI